MNKTPIHSAAWADTQQEELQPTPKAPVKPSWVRHLLVLSRTKRYDAHYPATIFTPPH